MESLGTRLVRVRIGLVLGRTGGALAKMLPPFRLGAGGRLGSGRQWMSWIHLDDLARLILHALALPAGGVMNGVTPNPVTNREFTRQLARQLNRPALFPAPAFVLKVALGEMSSILLASQRVLPKAAEASGFQFRHPTLAGALEDLLE